MLFEYIDPEQVYYTNIIFAVFGILVFFYLFVLFIITRVKEKDIDLGAKIK